ncbi:MAG: bifunctional phosphopantothenoylcysteine decarboxylase/phosphopantothenate--cysteine ligase CoaBC [Methylovulum sp.]|nr:bifunctional phosphopantothenoylcysteine decarboxylase/phosphopantothenate--cysteine ligase CoaBC [Methylovulum sp.]MCF7997886.1 bifunctional phosphopantothenoylcysteine decarboxylase/phosphopantothenate--cysteine ligase CoaBC [Methylovulum sp.]
MTANLNILYGVSGGIAAYKSAEVVRLLRKRGAQVRVVMTEAAMQFITPLTLQALSGQPVLSQLLDADSEHAMDHIRLARWADVILIAPATADFIAKCRHGLADDLLSTLYLAATCPVYIAPAMNQAMWSKPVVQDSIQTLRAHGVQMIGPEAGEQACGEVGLGRMSEPSALVDQIYAECIDQLPCLQGLSVLISAGPTREPLDPVRYLSNRSSGKMGYALAKAALAAGAKVTLISGPVTLSAPVEIERISVETAAEMYDAVLARASSHSIYIGAAAVADYSPVTMASCKIKKNEQTLTLVLQKTRDILADVAALPSCPFTVGFAAETHALEDYASAKLIEKNLDMIAANWVGQAQGGFDSELNALHVLWREGSNGICQKQLPMTNKSLLAQHLIRLIADVFNPQLTANT